MRTYPKRGTGPTAIEDSNIILHPMRVVKSETELALMRQAANISVTAHNRAREFAKPGRYEYEDFFCFSPVSVRLEKTQICNCKIKRDYVY